VRRANWLLLSFCFRGLAQPLIVGDAKTKGKRACLEDAEEYSLVSKLATDLQKQELLAKLSNQPRVMALEVERAIREQQQQQKSSDALCNLLVRRGK
jgi:hypothetical protein